MDYHYRYTYRIDVYGTTILPLVGTLVDWKNKTYRVTGVYKDHRDRHLFRMEEYYSFSPGEHSHLQPAILVSYARGNWYIRGELQKICIPKRDINTPMEEEWGVGLY